MTDLDDLSLVGVSLYGPAPLGAVHLPWTEGLTVLYGLNGVGKTTVLRHVESALAGRAAPGGRSLLHFRYTEAHDPTTRHPDDSWPWSVRSRASDGIRHDLTERWKLEPAHSLEEAPSTLTALVAGLFEIEYPDMTSESMDDLVARAPHFCLEADGTDAPSWLVHLAVELPEDGPTRDEVLLLHQHWNHSEPGDYRYGPLIRDPSIPALEIDEGGYDINSVQETGLVESGLDAVPWALMPLVLCGPTRRTRMKRPLTAVTSEADLLRTTVDALRADTTPDGPTESGSTPLTEEAEMMLALYGDRATEIYRSLIPSAPTLRCKAGPLDAWLDGQPIAWTAAHGDGEGIPVDDLSQAHRRWARLAICLTLGERREGFGCVLLDEPEASLHPLAVVQMARALADGALATSPAITASHAPALISRADVAMEVSRDHSGFAHAEVLTDPHLTPGLLGMTRTDALSLVGAFVLVEGPHDAEVLGHFLRDRLSRWRAVVIPIGGAAASKELEARYLAEFSEAPLVLLVDKAKARAYRSALAELTAGDPLGPARLDEVWQTHFGGKPTTEEIFIRKFCVRARELDVLDRVIVDGVPADDILDYLPVSEFVPDTLSWDDLRAEYEKSETKKAFKTWLAKAKNADLSPDHIRSVTRAIDETPDDIEALGARIDGRLL